jgi:hypothetical protein
MSEVDVLARFSKRINALPKQLRLIFLADLDTAIENILKVLEKSGHGV